MSDTEKKVGRCLATLLVLFALPVAPAIGQAQSAQTESPSLQNWFNDPFVQVRSGITPCPTPLGPLRTQAQMLKESHQRAERGTSCWLAGRCARPNAYEYDAAIAQAITARFAATRALQETSLWVTVQRRFVWVEGCVPLTYQTGAIETLLQGVPEVDRVLVDVLRGAHHPSSRQGPYPQRP